MSPGGRRRRGRAGWWVLLALAGLVLLGRVFREPLLTAAGRYLIVKDPVEASDVIVALGGGAGQREIQAAKLYHQGMGGKIILTGGMRIYPGMTTTWAELMAQQIAKSVPESLIVLETRSTSTWDDACYVLEDLKASGARSVIIVTDPFHLRRARATFHRVFRESGIRIAVVGPEHSWFRPESWWRREDATIAVFTEYLKMGFYAWHYHIWPWS